MLCAGLGQTRALAKKCNIFAADGVGCIDWGTIESQFVTTTVPIHHNFHRIAVQESKCPSVRYASHFTLSRFVGTTLILNQIMPVYTRIGTNNACPPQL